MGDLTLLKPMQNGDVVRYTMIDRYIMYIYICYIYHDIS
jgi:hypothetical protein